MERISWKTIEEDLRQKIAAGTLRDGERIPSGEDLAAQWGVSRHTAHRAVEELQKQGLVTRRRGDGTVVTGSATESEPTRNVALLVDFLAPGSNHPSSDLIRGLHDGLGEEVNLIVVDSKNDPVVEARQVQRLVGQMDGIVAFPTARSGSASTFAAVADQGYPLVLLDRIPPGLTADGVVTDNEAASIEGMKALVARGHRSIGFLSFYKPTFSSVADRYAGFQRVLRDLGRTDDEIEGLTRWFPEDSDHVQPVFEQLVHDAIVSLRFANPDLSALFCVEDSVARRAIMSCERQGLSLPDDMELVTFSNWVPTSLGRPWSIHRIAQDHYRIGLAAASLVLRRIANPEAERQTLRIPGHLILADAGIAPVSPSPI
jgi:DNA-binding LacI/PurR family transcriptional regulator